MKTIKSVLPKMIGFFLIMMVITSVIYPAVITAAANVAFGSRKTTAAHRCENISFIILTHFFSRDIVRI